MFNNMDPEARVYLVLVLVLAAAFVASSMAIGWAMRSAEIAQKRAKAAIDRAVAAERAHRDPVDVHFGRTAYGPGNVQRARIAAGMPPHPDDTLILNGRELS